MAAKRIPTQIFVGAYQGEEVAQSIERLVCDEEWDSKQLIVTNMAICSCDIAGKRRVKELGNPTALEAAASATVVGDLLGSVSRLMIGDRRGGDAKNFRRSSLAKLATKAVSGMDKSKLDKLGRSLTPGTSLLVLVFDEVIVNTKEYKSKMQDHKETTGLINDILCEKIKKHLSLGEDIAFHLTLDDDGLAATRTVIGNDAVQVRDIVMGHDAAAMETVTTTEKGVATETVMMTPDAISAARTLLTSSIVAYEVTEIIGDEDSDYQEINYEAGAVHVTKTPAIEKGDDDDCCEEGCCGGDDE
eukprot:CAMPEP_0113488076 /NCGR_PEP_ID=MMETSP0014_2-20120614/25831_1 /TAXON_ID=2857 /ORGANISM="Nitzschia sp." /LENGTH=301 /DNA_ID=CAMNT_0000381779 /DNA_START=96 /DNA_END=1001 /DNA_ORIENTATION=- /assembly_acc=CAM_ASM_000159